MQRQAHYLGALEELQAGSRTVTQERGARVKELLREVERRIRMDRVDPREMAEARERKATRKTLLYRPERRLNLRDALGRWTARLRGSPPGANRRRAEPVGRRRPEVRYGRT